MLRGTLRNEGYCSAWNVLVQLGCCDDTFVMEGVEQLTHAGFINSFLGAVEGGSVEEKICSVFGLKDIGRRNETTSMEWTVFR